MGSEVALLILQVLKIVSAGLNLTPELSRSKDKYLTQIEALILEDRGPTEAEYRIMMAEGKGLSKRIAESVSDNSSKPKFKPGDFSD